MQRSATHHTWTLPDQLEFWRSVLPRLLQKGAFESTSHCHRVGGVGKPESSSNESFNNRRRCVQSNRNKARRRSRFSHFACGTTHARASSDVVSRSCSATPRRTPSSKMAMASARSRSCAAKSSSGAFVRNNFRRLPVSRAADKIERASRWMSADSELEAAAAVDSRARWRNRIGPRHVCGAVMGASRFVKPQ